MDPVGPANDADRMQLAEALCARLCHDLSSPVGTLVGTLELVAEDAGFAAEALPLAHETAALLSNRIRLLRAAWAGDCGPLGADGLASLAAGLPPRVRLDVTGLPPRCFSAPVSRVLVNLILLAVEAIPRGGTITLAGDGDVLVHVEGPSAAWPEDLLAALTGSDDRALGDPRAVLSPLVVMLARAAGLRLSMLLAAGPGGSAVPPLLLGPP